MYVFSFTEELFKFVNSNSEIRIIKFIYVYVTVSEVIKVGVAHDNIVVMDITIHLKFKFLKVIKNRKEKAIFIQISKSLICKFNSCFGNSIFPDLKKFHLNMDNAWQVVIKVEFFLIM